MVHVQPEGALDMVQSRVAGELLVSKDAKRVLESSDTGVVAWRRGTDRGRILPSRSRVMVAADITMIGCLLGGVDTCTL